MTGFDQVKVFDQIVAHPDGSITVQFGSQTIDLPSLVDNAPDQEGSQPVDDRSIDGAKVGGKRTIHPGLRRLVEQLFGAWDGRDGFGQLDPKRLLGRAALALLFTALLLSHARQHIRDSETERSAA